MSSRRFLFAKFTEKEILGELGRPLYSLLYAFSSSGYQISLFDNISSKNLKKYGKLSCSLSNLSLTDAHPANTEDWIYLFDKEDKAFEECTWHKKVQVRFNIFSSYWLKNPIIMPYPVHPSHATADLGERLNKYRSSNKNMRIFFSGDTKGYTRNRVKHPKEKLPRLEIINTILERMHEDVLHVKEPSVLNNLLNTAYIRKCVIVDTNDIWVDKRNWLGMLASANFFLSPPGIVMPMCHNLIEAMSVGAIPITNYPEWLDPALTHMKDCIVFDDRNDLIEKLKLALEMDEKQIAKMRGNSLNYYNNYLSPDTFVHRIESRIDRKITVLLTTEKYMARKSRKLNRNSILLRGTMRDNEETWLKRISRHFITQR